MVASFVHCKNEEETMQITIVLWATLVTFYVAAAHMDVRLIAVSQNGDQFYMQNTTSHLSFEMWLRNIVYNRIKKGVSYGMCTKIGNISDIIGRSDGIKYTSLQLIHALRSEDYAYSEFLIEIIELHHSINNTGNLCDWLIANFKFPPKDMLIAVKNCITFQTKFNITFSDKILDFIISLGEKYILFEKAIIENEMSVAKWLLRSGYNISRISLLSKEKNFQSTIQQLFKEGSVSYNEYLNIVIDHEHESVIDFLLQSNIANVETILLKAINQNRTKIVDKYKDDLLNFDLQTGINLLQSSVIAGYSDIVKKLIKGGTPFDLLDETGLTPFYRALLLGDEDMIRAFETENGLYKTVTKCGKSLLSIAIYRNNIDVIKELIYLNASILEPDSDKLSPLQIAILNNATESLRILAEIIGNLSNVSLSGTTLAHYAVLHGSSDVLGQLLDLGADVDKPNVDRNTPLCSASRFTDKMKILLLAEYGANVSHNCQSGNTPLHFAVSKNLFPIVRVLTVLRANVNVTNDDDETPLIAASMINNAEIVEYLLTNKADKNFKTRNGNTLLHVCATYGSSNAMKTLIESGMEVHITNDAGESPILVAVKNNKVDVVLLLARKHANIHELSPHGHTLLHVAVAYGSVETMVALMKLGLSHLTVNYIGHSPITWAVLSDNYKMVWQMVNNAEKQSINSDLISLAASNGKLQSLKALTAYFNMIGTSIKTIDRKTVWSPLSEAVKGNHAKVVRFLIKNGSDLYFKSPFGDSLAHLAAINGSVESLEVLHEFSLPIDTINTKGETPLWLAAKHGHLDAMKLLKKFGADILARCVCHWEGGSLLLPAAYSGNERAVSWLLSQGLSMEEADFLGVTPLQEAASEGRDRVVQLLVDKGAEIDKSDINGWTPLHKAAYNGHFIVADILVKYGASLNLAAVNDLTPLHYAASNGYLDIVNLLCNVKADLDVQDYQGWTPLHWAAYKNHISVADVLLLSGANINIRSNEGSTPLQIAKNRNYKTVEDLLVSRGGII